MAYLLLRDRVTNWETFRASVDRDADRRRLYGCIGVTLLHSHGEPAEMAALLEFGSAEQAARFASARDSAELDAWLPIAGETEAVVLDEIEELPG